MLLVIRSHHQHQHHDIAIPWSECEVNAMQLLIPFNSIQTPSPLPPPTLPPPPTSHSNPPPPTPPTLPFLFHSSSSTLYSSSSSYSYIQNAPVKKIQQRQADLGGISRKIRPDRWARARREKVQSALINKPGDLCYVVVLLLCYVLCVGEEDEEGVRKKVFSAQPTRADRD